MDIQAFGVEMWMNQFENHCRYNLAETCVASITLGELIDMAGIDNSVLGELRAMRMGYGAIEGSERLRRAVAGLYENQTSENVLTTHGTIGANALVHQTLIDRGDHVIAVVPTYQQHYSIPASLEAEVDLLHLRPENGFLPDLERLRAMMRPDTRLIAINNPNNPTGALMDREMLSQIAQIAKDSGAWVLCDEVYRGTDQTGDGYTASICDLYDKGISTAGMSKAYSLAGLRVGWITSPRDLLDKIMIHRDYNTISVGGLDEYFSAIALENRGEILARAHEITRRNLQILTEWVEAELLVDWVKPRSGTTALLRYDLPIPSRDFCIRLLEEEGVLFTPGSAMDMEGWLRIGFANATDDLRNGLGRVSAFLAREKTAQLEAGPVS